MPTLPDLNETQRLKYLAIIQDQEPRVEGLGGIVKGAIAGLVVWAGVLWSAGCFG